MCIPTAKTLKIEASLACANFKNLEADLKQLSASGVDFLHIDIMDGRFVPNFALDFSVMQLARQMTDIPLDCHLMVEDPERYVERAAAAGAAHVTIHFEATSQVHSALQQVRNSGMKSGIALNPATPLTNVTYILDDVNMITVMTVDPGFAGQKLISAMIRKINDLSRMLEASGYSSVDIQVDGNVSLEHIPAMVKAGATNLVGGTSSIFRKGYSIETAISKIRSLVGKGRTT
jgi:ribulose-phosphate 3-epimerase